MKTSHSTTIGDQSKPKIRIIPILIATIIIAVIGNVMLLTSRATTSTISIESENGTKTSNVSLVTDSTASSGKAISFNAPSGGGGGVVVNATHPCVGNPAPAHWNHVIVLMFENKTYPVVHNTANFPYVSGLMNKCGSYANWNDANSKVSGTLDGNYPSKPNYATLTSGVSPSVHGLTTDSYTTTSSADNIFNRINVGGKTTKSYQSGSGASCASSNFSGAYHDAMRYYTNLGAHSSSPTTFCNTHDVPIANFTTDLNAGNLPNFSFVLPTNDQNTHNNSYATGDAWAQAFLDPIFNSTTYKTGDTAIFFLWDEDTPDPNVLIAPSIVAGSHPTTVAGKPIGHIAATRTWLEMLGLPVTLGDTPQAPSLVQYFDGN